VSKLQKKNLSQGFLDVSVTEGEHFIFVYDSNCEIIIFCSPGIKPSALKPRPIATPSPPTLKEEVPVQRKRKVFPEDEGHYTINLPQGSTQRSKKILAEQRQQAELQRIRAEEGWSLYQRVVIHFMIKGAALDVFMLIKKT